MTIMLEIENLFHYYVRRQKLPIHGVCFKFFGPNLNKIKKAYQT